MEELTVRRWTRYGKDRLYVDTAEGGKVGWVDLRTGGTTIERQDLAADFERAVVAYREAHGLARSSEQMQPGIIVPMRGEGRSASTDHDPARPPQDQEPFAIRIDWKDLGSRAPGQAAAEQARAERDAAPVRTFAARLLGVHTDERAWRIGAKGEELVAEQIERLPGAWHALHAIPVGDHGSDIDHFVVGPGGVFTINAKHHPDANIWVGGNTFLVNGHRQPYVRNSRHEARRASRLLSAAVGWSVPVIGVIAVVGARRGFKVRAQPEDVKVVTRRGLADCLGSYPLLLPPERVVEIHRAARRSTTWQ